MDNTTLKEIEALTRVAERRGCALTVLTAAAGYRKRAMHVTSQPEFDRAEASELWAIANALSRVADVIVEDREWTMS
jgi:hypothetical protein